jgi:apolipoprotein N-acyltransferase
MARRFETYLAGSIMLLIGLLLVALLMGIVGVGYLVPLFLIGLGAIFSLMALLKSSAPMSYEMSARTTLAYGLIAAIIGVLWITQSIQQTIAGYVLAGLLIFFGLLFLAYTRIRPKST